MGASSIETRIQKFIVENFPLRSRSPIDPDESLLGVGVIDSAGVLELVEFVEEEFGIQVPFDDLVPENFDTIRSVASYVRSRQAQAADAAA